MENLKWKPHRFTWYKIIGSGNKRESYKALRHSSSGFISRKDVRNYVFNEHGNLCYLCGKEATQIDHVISVARCYDERKFDLCNSLENLKPICPRCNYSKTP